MTLQANGSQKKAYIALFIAYKIDFKPKTSYKRQRWTLQNDKGDNLQDILVTRVYEPNMAIPKHVKQLLADLKEEIDRTTMIVGDINIPPTAMDRSSRQKVSKETQALNETLNLLDLIYTEHLIQIQHILHSF